MRRATGPALRLSLSASRREIVSAGFVRGRGKCENLYRGRLSMLPLFFFCLTRSCLCVVKLPRWCFDLSIAAFYGTLN